MRTIDGPAGGAAVEPRVMQVLLALVDANGAVLTRADLERQCWNGQIVGEDALNRAIFELRRAARAADAGFVVETIPRIGYRLVAGAEPVEAGRLIEPRASRRGSIVGGLSLVAAAGGLGLWSVLRDRQDPRVDALLERGRRALRDELPDRDAQGVGFLREAVRIEPQRAESWGLLAVALRNVAENETPERATAALRDSEAAARRALSLDAREGNALAALATLRPYFGDWIGFEDQVTKVLAVAPDNPAAISHLVTFLQSVGRERDSWNLNERAAALDPLSAIPQYRRAIKQWIFGRTPEADLTIDRALQLWPRHPAVWNARMMIFAYTGRPKAAATFLDDEQARPATLSPPAISLWRAALAALDSRSPADVAAARDAYLRLIPQAPGVAGLATMTLAHLGELDAAFSVTDGYLLRRGPLVGTLWVGGGGDMPINDMRWRRTMFLFTPATAPMRADPRFEALCDGIGLADYWRRRGVVPDYRRNLA